MNSLLQRISKDISETFAGTSPADDEPQVMSLASTRDLERLMRELERGETDYSL